MWQKKEGSQTLHDDDKKVGNICECERKVASGGELVKNEKYA